PYPERPLTSPFRYVFDGAVLLIVSSWSLIDNGRSSEIKNGASGRESTLVTRYDRSQGVNRKILFQ
ncbi:hypothetical protein, partial [Streptomyces boncukensis]|uniref:hypothetical protein n=1 Tax=Streptomyces boncukensis TaxID=2711219 RepID=UPI0019CFE35E